MKSNDAMARRRRGRREARKGAPVPWGAAAAHQEFNGFKGQRPVEAQPPSARRYVQQGHGAVWVGIH